MSTNNFLLNNKGQAVWLKRAIGAVVLIGFAWVVVSAISVDSSDEELAPMVVKAPEMVKQRPETPGGMQIDHQDKQLFDLLESEASVDTSEQKMVEQAKQTEVKNVELAKQAINKKELEKTVVKAKEVEVAKQQEVKKEEPVKAVEQATTTVKQEPKAPVAVKEVVKETLPETTQATTAYSGWAVQLGSFRKTADAERAVGVYTKKVGNILTGLKPLVKKVDLGDKGIVYRVYFTELRDKEHARQICNQLKEQKQACLRAKI